MSESRKWGKVGKVAIISLTLILLGAGIAYNRTDIGEASAKYEQNRDAAKKAGLSFSASDVMVYYTVPDADNGAEFLTDRVLKMGNSSRIYNTWTQSDDQFLREWGHIEPLVREVQKACLRGHILFKRDFRKPYLVEFAELVYVRSWVKVLGHRFRIASRRNDLQTAQMILLTAVNLTVLTGDDLGWLPILARNNNGSNITRDIQYSLTLHSESKPWLELYDQTLKHFKRPYPWRDTVRAEHWFMMWICRALEQGDLTQLGYTSKTPEPQKQRNLRHIPRLMRATESRFNQISVDLLNAIPEGSQDFASAIPKFESVNHEINGGGLSFYVVKQYLPDFAWIAKKLVEEQVKRKGLEAEIARLRALPAASGE